MINAVEVTKRFEQFTALDKVDLTIRKGSICGIVGANGAGKSTLFRVLCGVYQQDEGIVTVEDEAVYNTTKTKEKLFFVPDELYFLPGASLKRMAKFYEGVYPSFDRKRFDALVETFGLNVKKPIKSFSKGMKRQSAIVLALACCPKYLFLDETFDGLDPVIRNLVKSVVCQYVEEDEMTVVLSSHSLRELEGLCDQLALLYEGKLVFSSDVWDIKSSFFKIQVAFEGEYDESEFDFLNVLKCSRSGKVSNLIVKGDREETIEQLKAKEPVLLELVSMSLEEVFTYELGALGYDFDTALLAKEEKHYEDANQ